jgi:hypothetical protein
MAHYFDKQWACWILSFATVIKLKPVSGLGLAVLKSNRHGTTTPRAIKTIQITG